jgi:DNA-binding beta-propeller fold protein YncE
MAAGSFVTNSRIGLFAVVGLAIPLGIAACSGSSSNATQVSSAADSQRGREADFGAFTLLTTIAIPPNPKSNPSGQLKFFDISWVEGATQRYYLGDRSNAGVDIIDADHDAFLTRVGGFVGEALTKGGAPDNNHSGPNGVVTIHSRHELWAGDGDSTVKVIDLRTNTIVDTISTGGSARADEMSFDPRDHVVVVANNADDPPFITFISTETPRKVLGHIVFDATTGAPFGVKAFTDGLEQSVFDRATGLFYLSVPELDGDANAGALATIDPRTMKVTNLFRNSNCHPAGLTLGPRSQALVGCSDPSRSIVQDVRTGDVVATIEQVGGSDEVWFNRGDDHYYLAARNNPGGPVLGIIDAATNTFTKNVPTANNAHSVAADRKNNHVFVPLTPNTTCAEGCIGVYGLPREGAENDVGDDDDDG